eukprot:TRINITY_DN1622_c0_g2_i1.p1 TRINITY_DN1622_c0_g2~~TRINITY_DN1622_c0_g2_i1.p1  ORF type:complete len:677 (+),score=123.00 TRINITY_DN1622_c0_g2_i1:93-2123(+)
MDNHPVATDKVVDCKLQRGDLVRVARAAGDQPTPKGPNTLGPLAASEYAVVASLGAEHDVMYATLRAATGKLHRERIDNLQYIGRCGEPIDTRRVSLCEGILVQRGPDWCYGPQDGWPYTVGRVVLESRVSPSPLSKTITQSTSSLPKDGSASQSKSNTEQDHTVDAEMESVSENRNTNHCWTMVEFPGGQRQKYRTGVYGKFDLIFANVETLLALPSATWSGTYSPLSVGDVVLLADPSNESPDSDPLGLCSGENPFARVVQVHEPLVTSSLSQSTLARITDSESSSPKTPKPSKSSLTEQKSTFTNLPPLPPGFVRLVGGPQGTEFANYPIARLVHAPKPKQIVTSRGLRRGFRVARHQGEWKSETHDGGSGNVGTVVEIDLETNQPAKSTPRAGRVAVKWKVDPVWHSIGGDGVYELVYAEPPFESVPFAFPASLSVTKAPSASSVDSKSTLAVNAGQASVGDYVYLSQEYEACLDAKSGPLKPGNVGKIIKIDHSAVQPYHVETEGKSFWYAGQALIKLDIEPINDENSTAGVRVMRGNDWKWQDQDGGFGKTGRIVGPSSRGWANVEWDTGSRNSYRIGGEGKFDLIRAPDKPGSQPTPKSQRSKQGRLSEGASVILSSKYESCSDARQGPLKPGDVGTIVKDDNSSKPFQVKAANGTTWWYESDALEAAP